MLPKKLLITRTRKGIITPKYATLDEKTLTFSKKLVELYKNMIGHTKKEIEEEVDKQISKNFDYRFISSLIVLLERKSVFCEPIINDLEFTPQQLREIVFLEANRSGPVTDKQTRQNILQTVAKRLETSTIPLENALWSDSEEELILTDSPSTTPIDLLRDYNLSLAQTLLFNAVSLEIKISDKFQEIFRAIKRFGLMYTVEKRDNDTMISIDGATSIFKFTKKYGTSIAKVLPYIIKAKQWEITGDIIMQYGLSDPKKLRFKLSDKEKKLFPSNKENKTGFDSEIEKQFYNDFRRVCPDWDIIREPDVLATGTTVMIPDFGFQKENGKLRYFLEIVGFWTEDYLKRKLEKLHNYRETNLIIAVDKTLCSCATWKSLKNIPVIFFEKEVPIKEVLLILKKEEDRFAEKELKSLESNSESEGKGKGKGKDKSENTFENLEEKIYSINELAERWNVTVRAIKKRFENSTKSKYILLQDIIIPQKMLSTFEANLKSLTGSTQDDILSVLEEKGISSKNVPLLLQMLGYYIKWNGLDPNKTRLAKKEEKANLKRKFI